MFKSFFYLALILFSISSYSITTPNPTCLTTNGQVLDVNNSQVISWKENSKDQFHARAHIKGTLVNIYPDATGHHHMSVLIGPNNQDTIEVIYNEDFGPMPVLKIGEAVEACGDYITSRGTVGSYPASPDGAIVHWVHRSPNPNHMSGYVLIDGVLCGQDSQHAGPKK